MAVYQIIKLGDEILRQKSKTITQVTKNVIKLLENMKDTMYDAEGVGLAAPQIGILKRAIVIDVGEGLMEFINPEIVAAEGEEIGDEGCLSIPGRQGRVPRAYKVTVKFLDREGRQKSTAAEGMMARALQHEIDHLEGTLFIDKALPPEEEEV